MERWKAACRRALAGVFKSTDTLLVGANLASRAFGFLVSLTLTRTAGIEVLGAYSSLQISSSAPSSPLSLPLANSATLMAAAHSSATGLARVAMAHARILAVTALIGGAGAGLLLALTQGGAGWPLSLPASLLVVILLVIGQVMTQFMIGLFHGGKRPLDCAKAMGLTMALAIVLCVPLVSGFGVVGALTLAVLAAAGPGVWLLWRLATEREPPAGGDRGEAKKRLHSEAHERIRYAMPSVVSTVIRNGTSWLCCIYLTNLHFAHQGVGLITIGLQWIMLMQLPISSWGGRIVLELGEAPGQDPGAFRAALKRWLIKGVAVTALVSALVAAASPVLALMYKIEPARFVPLMAVNAVASVMAALTYIYERAAFCANKQRGWMWLSGTADAAQIAFTLVFSSHSIYLIAFGSVVSSGLLWMGAKLFLLPRRLAHEHEQD